MTLQELINETRSLINQTDPNNSSITDSQITGWINEAIRYILTKMKDIPRTENNITCATGDISISDRTLTIEEAYILNPSTNKYKQLIVKDISILQYINSQWLTSDAGEPEYFLRKSSFTYYLYPQPDSNWIGTNIKTFGMEFPEDLSEPTDEPTGIPLILQDAIPHYAAHRCFPQLNNNERANSELLYFRSAIKGVLEISTAGSSQNREFILTEDIEE